MLVRGAFQQVAQIVPVEVEVLVEGAVHVEQHRLNAGAVHPLTPPEATPLMIFLRKKMNRMIMGSTTTVAAAISFS